MTITIIDVAKRAGVSPGTVSNALSGKRPVADATRERIFAVIDELGYEPNLLARSLVSQRSQMLSIVVTEFHDLGYYGYSSALMGVQNQATALGYSLMLHVLQETSTGQVVSLLNEISARQVDGIVWAIHEIDDNWRWTQEIPLDRYPPIVHLNMHPAPDLTVVSIDNRAGARLATEHLLVQGCRSVGIITGPAGWWEAKERLAGWRESLEAADLPADESLVVEGDWLTMSGELGLERLLAAHSDLEAVFACNDLMALGALFTAHRLGIDVPGDLRIVGFDNMPESAAFWPPLTSIRQGLRQMGGLAIETLHGQIEGRLSDAKPAAPSQQVLVPELVARESSRCPKMFR